MRDVDDTTTTMKKVQHITVHSLRCKMHIFMLSFLPPLDMPSHITKLCKVFLQGVNALDISNTITARSYSNLPSNCCRNY